VLPCQLGDVLGHVVVAADPLGHALAHTPSLEWLHRPRSRSSESRSRSRNQHRQCSRCRRSIQAVVSWLARDPNVRLVTTSCRTTARIDRRQPLHHNHSRRGIDRRLRIVSPISRPTGADIRAPSSSGTGSASTRLPVTGRFGGTRDPFRVRKRRATGLRDHRLVRRNAQCAEEDR
jgi:hypothetical protein